MASRPQQEQPRNEGHKQQATSSSPQNAVQNLRERKTSHSNTEEGHYDDESRAHLKSSLPDKQPSPSAEAPPLPAEDPPLPNGDPPPTLADDGWTHFWDRERETWCFYNHWTKQYTYENPRTTAAGGGLVPAPENRKRAAGGYNPAIHGDYDANADYAKEYQLNDEQEQPPPPDAAQLAEYQQSGFFNRYTGKWQSATQGPTNHSDEAKSQRQMNAFFDVDAAANSHDGRSLKAERQDQRLSKKEVKAFKDKRRAKKEEKRRAWLRD